MKIKSSINDIPKGYYQDSESIHVAVDCIIWGFDIKKEKLKLLLIKRLVEPLAGEWSLVGSFVKINEDLDYAANRVLKELTGLENIFMEQLQSYGKKDRDPGARVISIVYWSLIQIDQQDEDLVNAHGANWFDFTDVPNLILDHKEMVEMALLKLQQNARYRPIGFELLPKKFTLPQLLKLYQEIYQKPLDDRNFRKKLISMNLLKKLDEKDKSSSKKGAYYYEFDSQKYNELVKTGFNFSLF
ncbi:NUDIX hydrolase [Flexithrix dorotheae]|uniref:NUDIX hydrolase n=1 Tax=Flexithrix dorotheae TaxID=70993 RepID=UPI00036E5DE6|nr:NUDIX domain-containing protein [Flexithrix dorotheae]